MPKEFNIRAGDPHDYLSVKEVFISAIEFGTDDFYSEEQRSAWKKSVENKELWLRKIRDDYFLVAEDKTGKLIGFGSLSWDGYLDLLYTHPDYQRQGVAKVLFKDLLKAARKQQYDRIYSDVSHWAKPFFEAHGFLEIAENEVERNGVKLTNFRMERYL